MKNGLLILATLFICFGCANAGNKSMKDMDQNKIDTMIVEGQTTKQDVQKMLGSPLETNFTDGGLLIWKYYYDDTSALTAETVGSMLLTFGLAGTKAEGIRTELVILFDENDVVRKFNLSESEVEAGTGIF